MLGGLKRIKMLIEELIKLADKIDFSGDTEGADLIDHTIVYIQKNPKEKVNFVCDETIDIHKELYKNYCKTKKILEEDYEKATAESDQIKLRAISDSYAFNCNAVYLHEIYFSDVYTDDKCSAKECGLEKLLNDKYNGGLKKFKKDLFMLSLVPRSGWVVLNYCFKTNLIYLDAIDLHHGNIIATSIPVMALDMWEHAYINDFGLNKKAYVDWFLKNMNWKNVKERLDNYFNLP